MSDNEFIPNNHTNSNPQQHPQPNPPLDSQNNHVEPSKQKQINPNQPLQHNPPTIPHQLEHNQNNINFNQQQQNENMVPGREDGDRGQGEEGGEKGDGDGDGEFQGLDVEQLELGNQFEEYQNEGSKQHIINISTSGLHMDSANIQKHHKNGQQDEETPFLWGQDEHDDGQNQREKRSFSQFFINSNLAKSQEIFSDPKKHKITPNLSKNQQKITYNPKKINDDVDIWQDLRKSMLEKESRISAELKNVKGSESTRVRNKVAKQSKQKEDGQKLAINSQKIAKKNIIKIGRSGQNEEIVNSIENMNRMILEKVKKWKKEQKQIEMRRIKEINNSNQKRKQEKIKQNEQIAKKVAEEKQLRVKAITQRMKKKQKRGLSTSPETQVNNEKSKVKVRKSKTQRKLQKKKVENPPQKIRKKQQNFSMFWNARNESSLDDKQKLARRKIFQQKVREVPVSVSEAKKLKMLIEIDKSSNPLKYNFLNKRGYDDEDIFKNHKDFKVPQNSKKIGIKYLQDLREKNKLDDLKRYMSQQSILNIKKYERSWKSPILQHLQMEDKPNPKAWKEQYKNLKIQEQDNNYLRALKKMIH